MKNTKNILLKCIDPLEFYSGYFNIKSLAENVCCPFHDDKTPSLSLSDKGYYCHSCGAKGTSVIGFYTAFHKYNYGQAIQRLWHKYIYPLVRNDIVDRYVAQLQKNKECLSFLKTKRGLSSIIIDYYKLGYDRRAKRITIPIRDQHGFVVDVRKYDWMKVTKAKLISYKTGYGKKRLYPISALQNDTIYLFEGEMDTLLAHSLGYNGITVTNGALAWDKTLTQKFKDKIVYVCYDNDQTGQKGALLKAREISSVAAKVFIITIPIKKADFTDYIIEHGHTKDDFEQLIKNAYEVPIEKTIQPEQETYVTLEAGTDPQFINKNVRFNAIVSGVLPFPYSAPKKLVMRCGLNMGKVCLRCPIGANKGITKLELAPDDSRMLELIDCTDQQQMPIIRRFVNFPSRMCYVDILKEKTQKYNVNAVILIPPIESRSVTEHNYAARKCYVVDNKVVANKEYDISAVSISDPKDQRVAYIATKLAERKGTIDKFEMLKHTIKELQVFQAKKDTADSIMKKIGDINKYLTNNVIRLRERESLLTAVNQVYHSPLAFSFEKDIVHNGYMSLFIIGDTQTGKGQTVERLQQFYGLGTVVSAHGATEAGLIGGMSPMYDFKFPTWGIYTICDRTLVAIDEFQSLPYEIIESLRRARSSGEAEITKAGVRVKSLARTRLIAMANPRDGHIIQDYKGAEDIKETIGDDADISRFDLCICVRLSDVSSKVINSPKPERIQESIYTQELFNKRVLFAWALKPKQIRFTKKATKEIYTQSIKLSRMYHPSIPIIQSTTIRFKLAKHALSAAVQVFSYNEKLKCLVVKRCHVRYASMLLHDIYSSKAMGYYSYSQRMYESSKMMDAETILGSMRRICGSYIDVLVHILLNASIVRLIDLQSPFSSFERDKASELLGTLVKHGCLIHTHGGYKKVETFNSILLEATNGSNPFTR